MSMNYVFSNSGAVCILLGNEVYTANRSTPTYNDVVLALEANDEKAVKRLFNIGEVINKLGKGRVSIEGDTVTYTKKNGEKVVVDGAVTESLLEMVKAGHDFGPLCLFLEKVYEHFSWKFIEEVWDFVRQVGIHLTDDGDFLAYKYVYQDEQGNLLDDYTKTFNNNVGQTVRMNRDEVVRSKDSCANGGFHVGTWAYSGGHEHIVSVKVNPQHIIDVPRSHSCGKMRVCEYTVLARHKSGEPYQHPVYKTESTPDGVSLIPVSDSRREAANKMGYFDHEVPVHWQK